MTNDSTPTTALQQLYMKPIPKEIGQLQFTMMRDKSGLNKLAPKYLLSLTMPNQKPALVMKAVNIFESATSHYKIQIIPKYEKMGLSMISHSSSGSTEDETYVGRLRSIFGYSAWFLYDTGINPKDKNPKLEPYRR